MSIVSARRIPFIALVSLLLPLAASGENPNWIWHNNHGAAPKPDEVRYFRRTFQSPATPSRALLTVAADDEARIYINGKEVTEAKGYEHPLRDDVTRYLKKGANVIAIRARNRAGEVAGVLV